MPTPPLKKKRKKEQKNKKRGHELASDSYIGNRSGVVRDYGLRERVVPTKKKMTQLGKKLSLDLKLGICNFDIGTTIEIKVRYRTIIYNIEKKKMVYCKLIL